MVGTGAGLKVFTAEYADQAEGRGVGFGVLTRRRRGAEAQS